MKKIIFLIATASCTFGALAQDKFVTSALVALSQNNLEEAKADIDRAMSSPETNEKSKTLLAKAQIYYSMQRDDKYKADNPYKEAMKVIIKLAEGKPDYKPDEVNPILYYCGAWAYQQGTDAYNNKRYAEATELLTNTVRIHDLGGGHRFDKTIFGKNYDTISANSQVTIARSAYYSGNTEEAIKQLSVINKNPITKSADNMIILLECYDKYNSANSNKMATEELAAIQEARATYPDNLNIRNMELNTFLRLGKMDELVKKLEGEQASDPNNPEINFNLGLVYQGLAVPKNGPKPANAAEYVAKSEVAFQKALKIAPDNAGYNYNIGTVYYMQAYDCNKDMNEINDRLNDPNSKLTQKAKDENYKKFDELKAKRDGLFEKTIPYFEKSVTVLSAKGSNMGDNDKEIYRGALEALKQIYLVLNKPADKIADVKKKLEALGR
ncbi:MAG: hypothetical protein EBZ77_04525 [Chitinophagia bacterium]|nr:hypothetical protein [Chitinophagia bacterium]